MSDDSPEQGQPVDLGAFITRVVIDSIQPLSDRLRTIEDRLNSSDRPDGVYRNNGEPITDDEMKKLNAAGFILPDWLPAPDNSPEPAPRADISLSIDKDLRNGDGSTAACRITLPNDAGILRVTFQSPGLPPSLSIERRDGSTIVYRQQGSISG